jgi:hypothetical protein
MESKMTLRDCRDAIELDVPRGYFICWNFTTQAQNKVRTKLYDNRGRVYMEETRQSRKPLPVISGSDYMAGDKLFVTIDVPTSKEVHVWRGTSEMKNQSGQIVARSIVILAEDEDDDDFNDVQLNITAFRSEG